MMMHQTLQHIPAAMMKGKTMAVAACVSVCMLGAEMVLVPMAMNSSYERYEAYEMPKMAPVEDMQKSPVKERSRLVPLTPITKRGSSDKAPVS